MILLKFQCNVCFKITFAHKEKKRLLIQFNAIFRKIAYHLHIFTYIIYLFMKFSEMECAQSRVQPVCQLVQLQLLSPSKRELKLHHHQRVYELDVWWRNIKKCNDCNRADLTPSSRYITTTNQNIITTPSPKFLRTLEYPTLTWSK